MSSQLNTEVLKGVSRSFYVSLRMLPKPMRGSASLAYLLARLSDTIADSAEMAVADRLEVLEEFRQAVMTEGAAVRISQEMIGATPDFKEKVLLERCGDVLEALGRVGEGERELIQEVLEIIIGGQRLDLQRFGGMRGREVIGLKNDDELEDYVWRVAGCVGVFWTKLGYLMMGERYSQAPEEVLVKLGRGYGEGLQLVNILRDLPKDLEGGRCYLPVRDPADIDELMKEWRRWEEVVGARLASGREYARCLVSRRLRVASGLPGLLGEETLGLMRGRGFRRLRGGVKVKRKRVYQLIWEAFWA